MQVDKWGGRSYLDMLKESNVEPGRCKSARAKVYERNETNSNNKTKNESCYKKISKTLQKYYEII